MKKFLIIIFILLLLFAAGSFCFVSYKGRALVAAELGRATGRHVTLGAARPSFPPGMVIKDLKIEGLARVPKAQVFVDLRALLGGSFRIASLEFYSPEVTVSLPAPVVAPTAGATGPAPVVPSAVAPASAPSINLGNAPLIERLDIYGGSLFVQAPSTGKTWILDQVRISVKDFSLSHRADFTLEASLAKLNMPFVGHLAKAAGWINWAARDMEATVEAHDEDGRVGLSVVLASRANVCEVKGRALLSSRQAAQATGKRPKMIEAAVLDLLDSSKSEIAADFSFQTALDHFSIGRVNIAGNITTGLQTQEISGNIVGSLKAAGAKLLEKDKAGMVKPYKF
ncbi:MAG: hypothetical protein WCO69_05855 [Candidatus Omnitrophota bacterium]